MSYPDPHIRFPMGPMDPRWPDNVWEAQAGPVAVEDMTPEHLQRAVGWAFHKVRSSPMYQNAFPALAAMVERLQRMGLEPIDPNEAFRIRNDEDHERALALVKRLWDVDPTLPEAQVVLTMAVRIERYEREKRALKEIAKLDAEGPHIPGHDDT